MSRRFRALALAAAPLPLLAAAALAGPAVAQTQPLVSVPGNTSPALSHSERHGAVDADTKMSVSVSLKLRNSSELDKLIADTSNPHSPQHGKFITPAQFNDRFAPTQSSVDSVSNFLRGQGLTVAKVSANRQVVTVDGTAAQLQHAFGTSLGRYTDTAEHRDFYANDSAPKLPADVASVVQGVVGLDNHAVMHKNSVSHKAAAPSGFTPDQLHGVYDTGSLGSGSGQTVALWEFDGYQTANISAYDKQFNLSSSAPKTVSVDNANYDSQPGQGQGEVELDIEIVQAMAQGASTLVYEAPNSDQGEIDMANQIATDNKVSVVSISWGSCEPDTTDSAITGTSNAIKQATAEGISFFSASGDDGSKDCTRSSTGGSVDAVDYPASDPNVTGVGGTHLTASGNSYGSESAWDGSGGGTSAKFDAPSYQQGVNGKRTVPDVSSDADPNTGYAIYSAGSWQVYGGTSCAAPMWAGFAALVGKKLGAANQALYGAKGTGFHDVTSGSNGSFQAGQGYDQVTGWGSYDGAKLAAALKG
ncbi:S53 family peptidase [Kutzneria sp. CA-103260]|uniref:S53 family peptidase n=1 Tax=Kutzneria sp. CA-103260 TaxID=2802641 RepID=UPI001BA6779C|nr:S53 family peptidase [Kutzneria sp. CA-103260]QUQ71025.1 pseudomonapepsin [Kutzneria sp. CA-103260]